MRVFKHAESPEQIDVMSARFDSGTFKAIATLSSRFESRANFVREAVAREIDRRKAERRAQSK